MEWRGDRRNSPDLRVFAVGVLVGGFLAYLNLYNKISSFPLDEYPQGESPRSTGDLRAAALSLTNHSISTEIEGYKFNVVGTREVVNLADFKMASGGNPFRNVIFARWRTGSTFLGDLFESHPGTFYEPEPELDLNLSETGLNLVKSLLSCDYSSIPDLTRFLSSVHVRSNFTEKKTLYSHCDAHPEVCQCPVFLSEMCRLHPILNVKLARFRLQLGYQLLEDKSLKNVRILLLIRDPRGILEGRLRDPGWCGNKPGCDNVTSLCNAMEEDYHQAKLLRAKYPHRFMAIRYEDIAVHPLRAARQIFKFLKLKYTDSVKTYLSRHVSPNPMSSDGFLFHHGETVKTAFTWKYALAKDFSKVIAIQDVCKQAFKLWGYFPVEKKSDLPHLNPVLEPPFPEMDLFED